MSKNKNIELSTIIGKGSKITGSLIAKGGIKIDGQIEGKIESEGFITISATGVANSEIKANECLVSGTVNGNIIVKDALELDKTANLTGDIIAKVLKIHTGAVFNGNSSMKSESKTFSKSEITFNKNVEEAEDTG